MTPQEAEMNLVKMGVIAYGTFGAFTITKSPKPKDLNLFVKCIKTLGAWSVFNSESAHKVYIQCGAEPDQIIFRVEK